MSVLADLPRRTKVVALLGLASVLVGGAVLSFAPLVRARAEAAAERRGVQLEIGQVALGWRGVWLKNVQVRVPRVPGVSARVDALRVGIGWHFNVSELAVHGGLVELKGEADELQRQFADLRAQSTQEKNQGGGGADYAAEGIDIAWSRRVGEEPQRAWALSYDRSGTREELALGRVRVRDAGLELEVRRLKAVLKRDAPAEASADGSVRQLESLSAEGLDVGFVLAAAAPVSSVPGGAAHAQKVPHFQLDPLRGPKLRAALAELSAVLARSLPAGGVVSLGGVSLHFRQGNDTLNFGPSALRVARSGGQIDVSLAPTPDAAGTPLELKASFPIAGGEVQAQVRGGPVSLRSLGVREGDFGLSGVQSATVQASGDVTLAADGSSLAFSGNGVLDRVSLQRAELSSAPLSGIRLAFRGRGMSSLDGGKLTIEDGEVSLGEVRVQGSGTLVRNERTIQAHWSGGVPLASCQAFLDATPRGLAPLIASLRMTGTFAVQAQLDYDSEHPGETRVRLNVANDCRIQQVPPELTPRRFEQIWRREVKGPAKQPMEVESGPGAPDWVPYDSISPFMETAVQVCEDGHFQVHHGFDFEAIQNSIRDNLIKGRFVRGASTISMQLAKNLYLGKEKTLGRKLQEAVLTLLLEQELSKRELMELYLNVIEYGPGVYGIGPASRYYFAKRPSELSLGQALYIASILPNPEHQHFNPDGKVSEGWTRYLQKLMHIAKKIGHVTDEQLATGLTEQVAFHVADSGGAPPAGSPSPEEGTDTPSELSP